MENEKAKEPEKRGRKLGQGSVYTREQVIQVHVLRSQGLRLREIAERTGMKLSSVSAVLTGRAWPHIKEMFDRVRGD